MSLPSLRLVRLDGVVLNTAAYADLLSLSLTSLDLCRSTLHIGRNGAERNRLGLVSACSLSTLCLPALIRVARRSGQVHITDLV